MYSKNYSGTFLFNPRPLNQNQNVLMSSRIVLFQSGTFLFNPKTFNRNQNVLMCSHREGGRVGRENQREG
jgi:hypothetical protein